MLKDTISAALEQIEDKAYAQILIVKEIPESGIQKCGFAFEGKTVSIG